MLIKSTWKFQITSLFAVFSLIFICFLQEDFVVVRQFQIIGNHSGKYGQRQPTIPKPVMFADGGELLDVGSIIQRNQHDIPGSKFDTFFDEQQVHLALSIHNNRHVCWRKVLAAARKFHQDALHL